MSPATSSANGCMFKARLLQPQVDFRIIRSWLDFCNKHHSQSCVSVDGRQMLQLQVIDCDTRNIVPATTNCEYLALSYRWGSPKSASVEDGTDEDNDSLPTEIPNVINDAIIVARGLGYRYLWVDRYCINQRNTTEFDAQIQQMDLIYNKAQATIIAAASSDPTVGLSGVKSRLRVLSVSANFGQELYVSVPPDPKPEILFSEWNRRCWTYQEMVLSRRRVVFCKDQVYFECRSMYCCEAIDSPLDILHLKPLQCFSKWDDDGVFESTSRNGEPSHPLHDVMSHIGKYTGRFLTEPKDILKDMLGILQSFEETYEAFFHHFGIPIVPDITLEAYDSDRCGRKIRNSTCTEQFVTGLCPHMITQGNRRADFPSWSWTGWHGQLRAKSPYDGYIMNTQRVKLLVEPLVGAPIGWESFCRSKLERTSIAVSSYVFIEAPCFQVRFEHSTNDANTIWRAVMKTNDQRSIYAPFYLTRTATEGDELNRKLLTETSNGFILGEMQGTYFGGGSKKIRLHNNNNLSQARR